MRDVWNLPAIAPWENRAESTPTQNRYPAYKNHSCIYSPRAWILDLFSGSSTTGIAANLCGRKFAGIEQEREFS